MRSGSVCPLFFLERHRHIGVGREADLVSFDIGNQPDRDIMVMPLVTTSPRMDLGQLDTMTVDMVDGAYMDAVGADDFHMIANLAGIDHENSSLIWLTGTQRMSTGLGANMRDDGQDNDRPPVDGIRRVAMWKRRGAVVSARNAKRSFSLSPPDRGDDADRSSNYPDWIRLGAPQLGCRKLNLLTLNCRSTPLFAGA